MALQSNLTLYNLTLQKATAITHAVKGSFSRAKLQEVVVARGKVLELFRPDRTDGKCVSVCSTDVFGVVRDLQTFRIHGADTDYLIVGSDSGKLSILEFDSKQKQFRAVHQETYGKTGCRRIVAGQYVATDPQGRACMVSAIEKQHLVYVLSRDSGGKLTVSSPLEATKPHSLVFSSVGVDVGFENPLFCCLELNYEQKQQSKPVKMLTFYELDLTTNQITQKDTRRTHDDANMLISVPGGDGGPGGVLVCAENCLVYQNLDQDPVITPLPRRLGQADTQGTMIICSAAHVQKNRFFFILQSEFGDLYNAKLTLGEGEDAGTVQDITVQYFDTLAPCVSLCVLNTGFLFAASEAGSHYLLQFLSVGDGDTTVTTTSDSELNEHAYFKTRDLTNLTVTDELESSALITDLLVTNLAKEETPQIYALCGKGDASSLRVMRHGLAVAELAVSQLPGTPTAVFGLKNDSVDKFMSFIVVSFVNASIVLSIADGDVKEIDHSGLKLDCPTLGVALMDDNSIVQMHPGGLRHIKQDAKGNTFTEWNPPGKKQITRFCANEYQIVVSLTGGELVYFELSPQGTLMNLHRKDLDADVCSLTIAPILPGAKRSEYMAVGSFDNTVRIMTLKTSSPLAQVCMQATGSQPNSLLIINTDRKDAEALSLYVGLVNGAMYRSTINTIDDALVDTRKRFLGGMPVKLFAVKIEGSNAVLALSSRSWLAYGYQNKFHVSPLSYMPLEHASAFTSEQCPEGFVCVSGATLRIISLEHLGEMFNSQTVELRYTPRKCVVSSNSSHLFVIEADQNAYPYEIAKQLKAKYNDTKVGQPAMQTAEDEDDEAEGPENFVSSPKAGCGAWASCIRVIDGKTTDTTCLLELEPNEAAFSLCEVKFADKPFETFVAVGTVKGLRYSGLKYESAFIRIYKVSEDSQVLTLMHKTHVEGIPLALAAWNGRLLAGVGKTLCVFELGLKKLIRKAENKKFPNAIRSIQTLKDRIYVGDIGEAFFYVAYRSDSKQLIIFANSAAPRYITSSCVMDMDTVAGADKFGNLVVSRLPEDASKAIARDPSGFVSFGKYKEGLADDLPKLRDIVQYHVGEMITSLTKAKLGEGGEDVLLYGTIMGGFGVFLPFRDRDERDFFFHLQTLMRARKPSLLGREHQSYRSYYFPVKDCIDGDLCEQLSLLSRSELDEVAAELSVTSEVLTMKLEDMKNKML